MNTVKNLMFKAQRLWALLLIAVYPVAGCSDFPVDDNGLLITERSECYISSFALSGVDKSPVTVTVPVVVEEETEDVEDNGKSRPRVDVEVFFGTDLKNLYPVFSLVTDALLEPKVSGLTDFSDLANPKQYTVISGNRKVRKTYTIYITVQQPRQ